jgi:hypothetical protein
MVQMILEGGRSDTGRLDLDGQLPPASVDRQGELYEPVLSHSDQHLRDISGRWRYQLCSPYRAMPRGYEALRIKP